LERASSALTTMLSAMNSPFQLFKIYSSFMAMSRTVSDGLRDI
jgi:hypothetical protein